MKTTVKYKYLILFCAGLLCLLGTIPAAAYDTAPRISDREILMIAMIGYMIWDRKTAQQPFKHKLAHLKNKI